VIARAIALGLTLLALAGCADMGRGTAPVPLAAKPPPDPKTQMPALEARLALLVEEQRIRIDPKARPLAIDPELSDIARQRAQDMATKNYLAHTAPDGETSATLLMAQDARYQGLLGENLAAQHYITQSGVDPIAFAKRFLDTWINSPAHRENLAFADYDRTGVGAAVNGDTVYVAQLFSTDPKPGSGKSAISSFKSPKAAKAAAMPGNPIRLRGAIGGPQD
jgi:uncharacterized protein YkwD